MQAARFWEKTEYRTIPPTPLHEFKELPPNVPINLPEYSKNRKRTDFACFIVFGILLLILLGLSIYIWVTTDLSHLSHDKDYCGNICGRKNEPADVEKNCEAKDYSDHPIADYKSDEKRTSYSTRKAEGCLTADECKKKEKKVIYRQCVKHYYDANFLDQMIDGITKSIVGIIVGALFAVCAMLGIYLCFRCNTKVTFTVILVCQIITMFIFVGLCWYLFFSLGLSWLYSIIPGLLTLLLIIMLIIMLWKLRKLYKLVIAIYEEAIDSIFNSKMLLAVPVVMALLELGLFAFIYWMSIVLAAMDSDKSTLRAVYIVLFLFATIWLYLFIFGCHVMIIAGVTAVHYFTRDKTTISGALGTSIKNTAFYHIGTIAFGSFIITLLKVIQFIIEMARQQIEEGGQWYIRCICMCIVCLCNCIEAIVDYLTRKAYIITAIHGKGLWASGVRGARLIWCFLLDIIYVDVLGYFVMSFVSFVIIVISCAIASAVTLKYFTMETLHVAIICCVLTFCVAFVIVYFYVGLMNVSAETIFLCYCEDKLLNDGSSTRPYFMTKRLIDVLSASLEIALEKKETIEKKRRESTST